MSSRARVLIVASLLVAALLARAALSRPSGTHGEALAWTECPWFGAPQVTVTSRVSAEDSAPVRRHEETHAAQCRALGALRYWMKNLSAAGRLALEAPAYCAGARARIAQGEDSARVRERLLDDALAAFAGLMDSTAVRTAIASSCPDVAPVSSRSPD